MTVETLLQLCYRRGIKLAVTDDGERLRVDAPKGTVTPAVRAALATHKRELIAILYLMTENEINEIYELDGRCRPAEGALISSNSCNSYPQQYKQAKGRATPAPSAHSTTQAGLPFEEDD